MNLEIKSRAFPQFRFQVQIRPHELKLLLRYGQTQAGAAFLYSFIFLSERLKDNLLVVLEFPVPYQSHQTDTHRPQSRYLQFHFARIGELHSVANEVDQDLTDFSLVAINDATLVHAADNPLNRFSLQRNSNILERPSMSSYRSKSTGCSSTFPASIFERSRISLIKFRRLLPLD